MKKMYYLYLFSFTSLLSCGQCDMKINNYWDVDTALTDSLFNRDIKLCKTRYKTFFGVWVNVELDRRIVFNQENILLNEGDYSLKLSIKNKFYDLESGLWIYDVSPIEERSRFQIVKLKDNQVLIEYYVPRFRKRFTTGNSTRFKKKIKYLGYW